ncbi:MAG: type IV secretory system conjugative DNA transfer family protein, partial [Eubacteriales bacterium]|nr:type IV secretory system conjugative DNA transfer family protein [Eubacteriales bacterium]
MNTDPKALKKHVAMSLPYVITGLLVTNIGAAWRRAAGADLSGKLLDFCSALPQSFKFPFFSLYPSDLLLGIAGASALYAAVKLKGLNKKNYKHGTEYGSARWGNHKDIEPFMDPDPMNNIILTRTEGLMMSNRPKHPKDARNKNVLVIGGSGSGKTRFWIKPNLLQCSSKDHPVSFVLTDP